MKYAVYTEDKDGSGDSFNCDSKKELNGNIDAVLHDKDVVPCRITKICKIVKGEYLPIDTYKLPINSMNW